MKLIKKQKGAALIYLAVGIVPLIAVLGLVIDYGEAAVCANRMQKAVDAAALAGASHLPASNAQHKAEELAESNYESYDGYDVSLNGDELTVTMSRSVPTRFMRIFGQTHVDVDVTATAAAGQPVGKVKGHLMPFCIVNPNTNDDPVDDLTPSNWGEEFIIFYGEDNCIVDDWANGGVMAPFNGDWEGEGGGGGNGSSYGWRGALDLNPDGTLDGNGANAFRTNIANSWPGTAEIDDVLPTESGNMSGPTDQGREDRLQGEEDELFDNFDPRTDYNMNRVVLVPVVSLIREGTTYERFTIDDFNAGDDWEKHDVIIDGFAPFWMLTRQEQGNVDGDNNPNNDKDWIVGKYIPGTRISGSYEGGGDYGAETPPRLID